MRPEVIEPKNSLRLARIERDEPAEIHEDENSHLWAVAYSDLLMVLLSFFILFYSIEPERRENLMLNLVRGIATETQVVQNESPQTNTQSMFADLKQLKLTISQEKETLTLNFSNELFKPGQFTVNKEQEKEIANVLSLLYKYKDQINIFFEGHADNTPILNAKNKIIEDNFVLSSLRATHALQLAKKQGFSEKQLFAQASSSNTRNTRSLSIRIEPMTLKTIEKKEL